MTPCARLAGAVKVFLPAAVERLPSTRRTGPSRNGPAKAPGSPPREGGFTMIELMIVIMIIALLAAIAVPILMTALTRSHRAALVADGRTVYDAFTRYYTDNGVFPSTSTPTTRAFNTQTMSPLSTNGYVLKPASITGKLRNRRFTGYDSPNVGSSDTQFWTVMTHGSDPRLVLLVANTNQYPGHAGTWYDGLYFIEGSVIKRAEGVR